MKDPQLLGPPKQAFTTREMPFVICLAMCERAAEWVSKLQTLWPHQKQEEGETEGYGDKPRTPN
jgi:hypothetical protein